MAITNQRMLFLTLVSALMVKVNSVFPLVGTLFSHAQFHFLHSYPRCRMAYTANGLTEGGYDETVVNALLVGSGLTVLLASQSFAQAPRSSARLLILPSKTKTTTTKPLKKLPPKRRRR
jgi:hypothetical protein